MCSSILSLCQRGHKWCRHGRFWVSLSPSRKLFRPTLNGKCGRFCQVSAHHLTGMEVLWLNWGQYWGLLGIPNGDQVALSMKRTWKEGGTNCWRTTTIRPYIRIEARNCVRKWLFLPGFPLVWTITLSVWYLFWLFNYLLICLVLLAHAHFLVNMCQKKTLFCSGEPREPCG